MGGQKKLQYYAFCRTSRICSLFKHLIWYQPCAVTIMQPAQYVICQHSEKVDDSFEAWLNSLDGWTSWMVDIWVCNLRLQKFQGDGIWVFTESCDEFHNWWDENIDANDQENAIKHTLKLWPKNFNFLRELEIGPNYKKEIQKFEEISKSCKNIVHICS